MNDKLLRVKNKLIELGYKDNEWLFKYLEMLEANLTTPRDRQSTQEHHAIPVNSYWTSDEPYNRQEALKLSRADTINFKVHLVYKDHLVAHSYLTLCTDLDEVQRRYEAQATLRKANSKIGAKQFTLNETAKPPVKPDKLYNYDINSMYMPKYLTEEKILEKIDFYRKAYEAATTKSEARKYRVSLSRWQLKHNQYLLNPEKFKKPNKK